VLATPVFVALAAGLVMALACFVFLNDGYSLVNFEVAAFYTTTNLFLAYMIVFVLLQSNWDLSEFKFDKLWIAGVVLFFLLLALTYGTSFPQVVPVGFGLVYMAVGVLVLGLIGQVKLPPDIAEMPKGDHLFLALILAISGFIVTAYGQIGRGSWLWTPPKDDEIKVGAWLLGKMAADPNSAPGHEAMQGRIVDLLVRLKLIGITEAGAALTPKGLEFIRAVSGGAG
jgi:hypothetical protein